MRPNPILLLLLTITLLSPAVLWAADPQPYDVRLVGDATDLDEYIRESSLLFTLREVAPAPPLALINRAQRDVARIGAVTESFGYYAPVIEITIAGKESSDASVLEMLDEVPAGQKVEVVINVTRGPLYRLGDVVIEGSIPDGKHAALGLVEGAPAIASTALAAQANLLSALQEDGYAFARVDAPIAYVNDQAHLIDLHYIAESGPRMWLGDVRFNGLQDVNESFAREALTVRPGELYQPSKIEAARQSLAKLGVFSGVSVRAGERPATGGKLDLIFDVQERLMHTVSLSGAYSTDLGVSASVGWSHHNLFGNAEQLNLVASITDVGGKSSDGIGYNLSAQFVKPHFLAPHQSLTAEVSAVKQDLEAYSQTAENLALYVNRDLWPNWKGTVGVAGTYNQVSQQGVDYLYYLVSLPLMASYDDVDQPNPLVDPSEGFRLSLSVAPTLALGTTDLIFATIQISGSAYFDLTSDGGTIVALRGLAASIQGASNFDVPPDRRLYAGGSGTVRGFRYQSIGPSFADGSPTGATSVDAVTAELRQRIDDEWGAAIFVDAGQASTTSVPFNGAVNVGAGAGVRYYTSIGAIRADVAVPLTQGANQDSFELYIGLGQSF